jgi:hypothetical protein|tara:strand:- start:1262 stop:1504 length:243 start_codon:yes stop_codon:yes gene_type:complete
MSDAWTFYSDEPVRGAEMFCDMCNAQWPKWYYRVDVKDVYPYACVCESCMLEMISQNDEDEEDTCICIPDEPNPLCEWCF